MGGGLSASHVDSESTPRRFDSCPPSKMVKWNGILSPTVVKNTLQYSFVPIDEMTNSDWDWLDYENIRDVAKNRLAKKIMAGLAGFVDVRILPPGPAPTPMDDTEDDGSWGAVGTGKAKRRYLFPMSGEDEGEFENDEWGGMVHVPEVDDVDEEVDAIENAKFELSLYERVWVLWALTRELPAVDERGHRALDRSEQLTDENFFLFAAVIVGRIRKVKDISYEQALEKVTNRLDGNQQIAAAQTSDFTK